MPPGNCFRCHQPGHWANNCPLKNPKTTDAVTVTSPPVIHCPCNGGVCNVLTSKTVKNPNRRFYTCPSCGFFKWCDQVSVKSEPITDHPTCTCGSGPCRRVTVIDGPNAQRSYFVCSIKKGFGACEFFKWEDEVQILPEVEEVGNDGSPCSTLVGFSGFDFTDDDNLVEETELDSDGNVKRIGLGVVVGSDLISTPSNKSTLSIPAVKDFADTLGKESIPVCSSFNNRKAVSNGGLFSSGDGRNQGSVPSFDLITVYDDAVHVETKEQLVSSLAPKHIEPQVETLCSDYPTNGASLEFDGNGSYALEGVTDLSQNTSNPNGKIKPEHQDGDTGASSSGSSSLMVDLIEQYNSEKLHFENVSMKHVDALAAFTDSYKQLATLRGRAHSLMKQLFEVEAQVKLYEAKTSEFAATLQEVSDKMAKSQKKMSETARKIAK